ncbi:MAG: radical SAM protein, partial [Halobacteriovoraceae bacterium]|nr:radical SAM protein [Halobacteriovoraceae bacterium]
MTARLVDPHGRHIHKLRLSLLDACNFRCVYCMPHNPKFLPPEQLLSRKDIKKISGILVNLGIDEIRLTGGEPTMRADFLDIANDLSDLKLRKLAVTSNGFFLKKNLLQLSKTNCRHINLSMDGLTKKTFLKMTGSNEFAKVLDSLFRAKDLGFKVKINSVLMKGINDHEIEKFVEFSGKYKIEVRFLELMKIGPARKKFKTHFMSASETINCLRRISPLIPIKLPIDSTSFNFKLENGANIGLIASESRPFCTGCSRLRLTAQGEIRPCLMMDRGMSLV